MDSIPGLVAHPIIPRISPDFLPESSVGVQARNSAILDNIRNFKNNKMYDCLSRGNKILNLFLFGKAEQLIIAEPVGAKLYLY